MIQSRILRHKIEAYAETATPAPNGQRVKTYTYAFPDRTEITFKSGREEQEGSMGYAAKTMKFKVRHKPGRYTERMLIKFEGDYYNIRSINPDRTRWFDILECDRVPEGSVQITV
jgi:head-tail adaptor